MKVNLGNKKLLGINGLGRIGKLLLWNQLHLKYFDGIVVNCGRIVGKTLDDLIQVIEMDSTYGSIHKFLYGVVGKKYRDWETDRKSTRLNSSHITRSRMPSSA